MSPTCDDATRRPARCRSTFGVLLTTLALFALTACERETTGDPDVGAPAPINAPPSELSGAPATISGSPPIADAPPPSAYVPPEAPTAAPSAAPVGIVAMEPIPNPPEFPIQRRRRVFRREVPASHSVRIRHHARAAPTLLVVPVARIGAHRARTPSHVLAKITRPEVSAVPAPTRPFAPSNVVAPRDDRATRLAALQGALARVVLSEARLALPRDLTPDRPSEITLTLPAEFADAVRREAGRQGLSDAAASVSLSARLSGDGYTAMPDDAQVQPLQSARETRFHWTAISQAGARGPLQAEVSAQLLGEGGDTLNLGIIKPQVSTIEGWRALGVGLLALALLVAVAWLGRSRRPRPRPDLRPARPFDMSDGRRL